MEKRHIRYKNRPGIAKILAGGLILCLLLLTTTVAQHVSAASSQDRPLESGVGCPATLYPGSRGTRVMKAQQQLNNLYRFGALNNAPYDFQAPLPLDGVYAADTLNAIKDIQAANNIQVNGVIDAETWMALGICASRVPTT